MEIKFCRAKPGQQTKACLQVTFEKATCATKRCTSLGCMGLVTRSLSLFLKDWELARVALSCHMVLDMLCQERHEARWLGEATERPAVTV